jgi:FKBP-type peptidyl-prolyl cis-trans isomerase SlyD
MIISKPCVVKITWILSDAQNQPLDEMTDPTEFFYGGGDLLPKIEEVLEGHEPGEETRVQLEPEQAFGDYQPELVCFEARGLFPDDLEPGMRFEGLPQGAVTPDMPADAIYTVTEVYPSHAVLDGNHPLAGMALRMLIKVVAVREATEDEIEAGTVGQSSLLSIGPGGSPSSALH